LAAQRLAITQPFAMSYVPTIPRARIGFIIPSSNRVVEPQMQRYAPAGVVPHFVRLRMTNRHRKPLPELLPQILDSVALLMDSKCDVIVFQCTGTSMSGGVAADDEVVREIRKAADRPAISTAGAVRAALSALGANRLVFISETGPEGHAKKLAYLKEAGYDVVRDRAARLSGSDEYCATPPEFWYGMVLALRDPDADAYFISCANIHSMEVIERLESELGKPVITSNQAALWCALRELRIRASGPGSLFTR
jgi:maleate cis-trans isomerase